MVADSFLIKGGPERVSRPDGPGFRLIASLTIGRRHEVNGSGENAIIGP
jgi:hypothetical protein